MTNVAPVCAAMQEVLTKTADRLARPTGFLQRQRTLTGSAFVESLVFSWLHNGEATLAQLSQTAALLGFNVTPQAFHERFSERAALLLERVLSCATAKLLPGQAVAIDLLGRFKGVYLLDTSTIELPVCFEAPYPGSGGSTPESGRAALKLEVRLELVEGQLEGPLFLAGRRHDQSGQLARAVLPEGALRLADLGYFSLDAFEALAEGGAFWLSRLKHSALLFDEAGQRLDVLSLLSAAGSADVQARLYLGKHHQLPARLLARAVPEVLANERRRRLHRAMQKQGRTPSARSLALCGWTILVTNVPSDRLSLEEAMALLGARWQIELLFKRWKSHGRIDESRSVKPWRRLCEIYAKLLAMLLQHWIVVAGLWHRLQKSLVKASRTVSAHALHLAASMASGAGLRRALSLVVRTLERCPGLNPRRRRPNTYQRLLNPNIGVLT